MRYICMCVCVCVCVCVYEINMCMLSCFSHVQLCGPMDWSLPDFSAHGIIQAKILEWVVMSSSRGSSQLSIKSAPPMSPALAGGFFTTSATGEDIYYIYIHTHTHTHIVEYYSLIISFRKSEILPLTTTKMNLEGII